jgi:hypothetical protein
VVADVRHRLHHLWPDGRAGRSSGGRAGRSWSGFFHAAGEDPLLAEGARLVAELAQRHEIVWLTGRPEWLRRTTADWLKRHGLPGAELHLRPDGDFRPARHYKLDVLHRLAPRSIRAFVDDDAQVIDAAVAAGFPAVLADWVPRRDVDDVLTEAQERLGRT